MGRKMMNQASWQLNVEQQKEGKIAAFLARNGSIGLSGKVVLATTGSTLLPILSP